MGWWDGGMVGGWDGGMVGGWEGGNVMVGRWEGGRVCSELLLNSEKSHESSALGLAFPGTRQMDRTSQNNYNGNVRLGEWRASNFLLQIVHSAMCGLRSLFLDTGCLQDGHVLVLGLWRYVCLSWFPLSPYPA